MWFKSFPLNTSNSFIISLFFAFSLSHCSTTAPKAPVGPTKPVAKQEAPVNVGKPHAFHIVNSSEQHVDTIRFKPCGTAEKHYATLASNVRPKEKLIMNVYEVCIDVLAEDAFQQTVYEQNDIRMTQKTNLNIK